jgi:hypothetical protein
MRTNIIIPIMSLSPSSDCVMVPVDLRMNPDDMLGFVNDELM